MVTVPLNIVREDDLQTHIEDSPLFWVFRDGRNQQVTWNQMSEQERADTIEAERRDYYNTVFEIY
jgi:hypothetical protein